MPEYIREFMSLEEGDGELCNGRVLTRHPQRFYFVANSLPYRTAHGGNSPSTTGTAGLDEYRDQDLIQDLNDRSDAMDDEIYGPAASDGSDGGSSSTPTAVDQMNTSASSLGSARRLRNAMGVSQRVQRQNDMSDVWVTSKKTVGNVNDFSNNKTTVHANKGANSKRAPLTTAEEEEAQEVIFRALKNRESNRDPPSSNQMKGTFNKAQQGINTAGVRARQLTAARVDDVFSSSTGNPSSGAPAANSKAPSPAPGPAQAQGAPKPQAQEQIWHGYHVGSAGHTQQWLGLPPSGRSRSVGVGANQVLAGALLHQVGLGGSVRLIRTYKAAA